MRHVLRIGCVLAFVLVVGPVRAQAPAKIIKETWDAAYFQGAKAGFFHTFIAETERDGKKVYITTQLMSLNVLRDKKQVELRFENGQEETADGKVLAVFMTLFQGPGKLTVNGRVKGDKLIVQANGAERELPWDPKVLGLYAQERLWKDKKVKAGDMFEFVNYELAVGKAFTVKNIVKKVEETDVLEVKPGLKPKAERVKRSLLRVETTPDKVEIEGKPVPLPTLVSWLDKDYSVLRSETEMPGLGRVVTYRTTKEVATEEGTAPALLPDLLLTTLIPVNMPIEKPFERNEVVFRITLRDDKEPATAFTRDARQSVENIKGSTFDLRIRAQRTPATVAKHMPAGEEYLKSNYFIDSANEKVKELAVRAVGTEKDPWEKAKRIEKWVKANMEYNPGVVFGTASQVAKDRQGDCRQHAMLTAAMCRAAGVPSRTALGLVYATDREKGPILAFHMWTEVFVRNQWLGLDATLGQGSIGATHIKVADHSWYETQTLAPLLPVLRVVGKLKVEVVSVK